MKRLDNEAEGQIAEKAIEAEQRGELDSQRTFHWSIHDKDMRHYKVRVKIIPLDNMTLDIDYTVESPSSEIGRKFICTHP